ncbi:MAG: DUF551 domain-containing protein [Acidaminococcaceae bacterium]|nr:DUF551 domain-containing protein [Acidaminococcaceae bacterium]
MYDELVKSLRQCAEASCAGCKNDLVQIECRGLLQHEAADAIEERDRHILTLQHEMMAEAESHTAIVERLSKQNKKLEEALKTALDFIPCWIPVTERLPKAERKSYWVCTDTGYQCECRWTNDRFGIIESDEWGWKIFDIPQYQKVVAWMQLPCPYEPPKEEAQ